MSWTAAMRTIGACAAALCALAAMSTAQTPETVRRNLDIATGLATDDVFLLGERLAEIVSHPPGTSRCDDIGRCGPKGLIASARTVANSAEGLRALEKGGVSSAIVPAHIAASGKLNTYNSIASLGDQTLHLVSHVSGPVRSVARLKNRWLSIGPSGSAAEAAANALFAAAGLSRKDVRTVAADPTETLKLFRAHKIDAFLSLSAAPSPEIGALIKEGLARLVPIDGNAAKKLAASGKGFEPLALAGNIYAPAQSPQAPATMTVSVPMIWLVDSRLPPDLVYSATRALWNKANKALLDHGPGDPGAVRPRMLKPGFAVPLHPGAAKLFAEMAKASN